MIDFLLNNFFKKKSDEFIVKDIEFKNKYSLIIWNDNRNEWNETC